MKLFSLSTGAYHQYISTVKGNINTTYTEARLKLIRNVLLSTPIKQEEGSFSGEWYAYGKLRILVDSKKREIICVLNNQPIYKDWELNLELKDVADKILELK